jgi:hypothetical protein
MRFGIGRAGAAMSVAAALLAAAFVVGGCGAPDESAPVAIGHVGSTIAPPSTRQAATATTGPAIPTADAYASAKLIDHTRWTTDSDGRRLHVYPTPAGRKDWYPPALDRAWGEVLADAPEANTPGMYDQFKCHWQWARLVAPDKPDWNLEPWRPVLGFDATVKALCNPGGPDLPGK